MPEDASSERAGRPQSPPPVADGEDRLVAVPRGPRSVLVYWDLLGARSSQVAEQFGPTGQWVLRVLNLSTGATRALPVDVEAANYYVEVTPGQLYGFELAVRAERKWRTVCRTSRVPIPPAPPSGPETPETEPRVVARGFGIPGLSLSSTPLHFISSPHGGGPGTDGTARRPSAGSAAETD